MYLNRFFVAALLTVCWDNSQSTVSEDSRNLLYNQQEIGAQSVPSTGKSHERQRMLDHDVWTGDFELEART